MSESRIEYVGSYAKPYIDAIIFDEDDFQAAKLAYALAYEGVCKQLNVKRQPKEHGTRKEIEGPPLKEGMLVLKISRYP